MIWPWWAYMGLGFILGAIAVLAYKDNGSLYGVALFVGIGAANIWCAVHAYRKGDR